MLAYRLVICHSSEYRNMRMIRVLAHVHQKAMQSVFLEISRKKMQQTFDRKVPEIEQRLRVANAKQPGRKHNHQPSSRISEKRKAGVRLDAKRKNAKFAKFKSQIRAYWLGEIESYPEAKK